MQHNYGIEVILLGISVLLLQQQPCAANPAAQRLVRQTKGPNNTGELQTDVKILNGLSGNQPQMLPGFGGPIPYGGRYGGLAYGGSGYPGIPGLGLLGMQFGGGAGAFPGFNALQMGNAANLGFPTMGNYVGNNLPPYPLNGPEVYANPFFNSVPNLENFMNMANMQGNAGSGSQTPLQGAQAQLAQMQLQGQASQPQPQFAAGYPFTTTFYGPLAGYGQGFQGYQLLQ